MDKVKKTYNSIMDFCFNHKKEINTTVIVCLLLLCVCLAANNNRINHEFDTYKVEKAEEIALLTENQILLENRIADLEEENDELQVSYNLRHSGGGSSSYSYPTEGLTKSGGVYYYDGRKETYYSSNVLYHYMTPEWSVDDEGFYRDSNGYYVVAASDMDYGTTFEGSKGTCIVLDSGCAAGTTDYYVAW